jgi:hypothetical protein
MFIPHKFGLEGGWDTPSRSINIDARGCGWFARYPPRAYHGTDEPEGDDGQGNQQPLSGVQVAAS